MTNFHIDPEHLKDELAIMPAHIADIARRVAEARNKETAAERSYKLTKYVTENNIREMYRPGGVFGNKPTEDAIKMEVSLHPAVKKALNELSDAECTLRLLEAELMAYSCKRDMLVSLAAYLRSEMETIRLTSVR